MALLFVLLLSPLFVKAQQPTNWLSKIDTVTTFSTPRTTDLNQDGILDIIIGAGLDAHASSAGVVAVDGNTGTILWTFPTDEEIFASAIFRDITGDGVDDIFIGGRYAECYAINGATGQQIWEFFPLPPSQAVDNGWFNIYSMQWIDDQSGDGIPDLLAASGGNHAAPSWDTLRDPGLLVIINTIDGSPIVAAEMPDGEETYCSPLVKDIDGNGELDIIYGSGGENDKGSLWRTTMSELRTGSLQNSIELKKGRLGFVAPSSLADVNRDGCLDIINQSYEGELTVFNGKTNEILFTYKKEGVESSNTPVIGNFTGDLSPDIFLVLSKGKAPTFFDFYQVLIDGGTGEVVWEDSIGAMHYSAASAVDLNGDGRDEAIIQVNFMQNHFQTQVIAIDFEQEQFTALSERINGVNLGSSVLISDLDYDNKIDIVFALRADSLNPMAKNGFKLVRRELNNELPSQGIAWGDYMGTMGNGEYLNIKSPCDSLNIQASVTSPSCNLENDARIDIITSGAIAPYTYHWSTGSVDKDLVNIPKGIYELRVNDAGICYKDTTFVVEDPFLINFNNTTDLLCHDYSDAKATVNSTGCNCSFSTCTFDWSSGDSIMDATQLSAGYNYVTITHPGRCQVIDSIYIQAPTPISLSYDVTQYTLDQNAVYASATGGIPPYSFNLNSFTASNGLFDQLFYGNYYLKVIDNNGCSTGDSIELIGVIAVNQVDPQETLQVFPNPVHSDRLYIQSPKNNIAKVSIWNLKDQEILELNVNQESFIEIGLKNLGVGMYSVNIYAEENKILKRTLLIKQ